MKSLYRPVQAETGVIPEERWRPVMVFGCSNFLSISFEYARLGSQWGREITI